MRVTVRVWLFVFISFFMSGALTVVGQEGSCPSGDLAGQTYYGRQARIEFGCEDLVYFIAGEGKTTHNHQLTLISDVPFIQLYDVLGDAGSHCLAISSCSYLTGRIRIPSSQA